MLKMEINKEKAIMEQKIEFVKRQLQQKEDKINKIQK